MEKKKTRVVEIISILIAIIGLGVTIWQATSNYSKQQDDSSPKINFHILQDDEKHEFVLSVINQGKGTAIVEQINIISGSQKHTKWHPALQDLDIQPFIISTINTSSISADYYINTQEKFALLTLPKEILSEQDFNAFLNKLKNLSVEIHYKSSQNETYSTNIALSEHLVL